MNATQPWPSDIRQAVDAYLESGRVGDSRFLRKVTHPDARIFGFLDGRPLLGPLSTLFDYMDTHPGEPNLDVSFESLIVSETAASAHLRIRGWHGRDFDDHLQLLKIDGGWYITNKTFHQHR